MKKFLLTIFLLLFLPLNSHAVSPAILANVVGGACADCTTYNASFIWECNSATVGDTGYSPCGCSDGDTSAAANSDATITSGGAVFDDTVSEDGQDYYAFDNGADVLTDDELFTIFVRFKVTTWIDDTRLFKVNGDGDNFFVVVLTGADDLAAQTKRQATFDNAVLSGNNVATGTEYILRYRTRIHADADHGLALFSTTPGDYSAPTEENEDDEDLVAFNVQAGDGDFTVGNAGTDSGANITVYYIHVYNDWIVEDPND